MTQIRKQGLRHGRQSCRAAAAVSVCLVAGFVMTPVPAGAESDRPPQRPVALTVDDDPAPLAVAGAPAFGWRVVDTDRGEMQTAYELRVSESGRGGTTWRSGRITSSQQSYVGARGLRVTPDRAYTWTVRTWDRAGKVSPFAAPARFDTALADRDWKADWVRRPGAPMSPLEDFGLLRKRFTISRNAITRARVYVAAGQQYDLRLNGKRVAHGPSFSYPDAQYYDTVDVTKQLHAGAANVIAAVTHYAGAAPQGQPASTPAFIAHLTIDHADGTRDVVTTDTSWRTHAGPWTQGPPRNDEGEFVERIDGRLVPARWDTVGFDDSSWAPAQVLGPHPTAPFAHLVAARTHLVERKRRPVSLRRFPDGSSVADFGAVVAATPVVELHRGVAGRAVKLVAGYLLDRDGHVSTTNGVQLTDMHWDYTERAGTQEIRPFGYLAFRYLEVVGARETLRAGDVMMAARHASMPNENAATFRTSDPRVDAVWDLARSSALYDTQEQFLDTPTRERGQFLLDAFNVSQATMAAFGERAMTAQALRDFAQSQQRFWPDGRVNAVYPNGDGKRDIPDFTEAYVEWVWRVWETTGDFDQLLSLYPVVKNISDYVARAIDARTGLVTDLPGGSDQYLHGIVDWPPNMRYGYDMDTVARTTENVLAVDVFARVAQMATTLGRPASEVAGQYQRAAHLTTAIRSRLARP
ncbi:MAG: alpha-L-rhamnosidase, partial [Actinomycetota bacterium]|nr:alpha-L-rhamnosidase [Actinomycetota bacterium]